MKVSQYNPSPRKTKNDRSILFLTFELTEVELIIGSLNIKSSDRKSRNRQKCLECVSRILKTTIQNDIYAFANKF